MSSFSSPRVDLVLVEARLRHGEEQEEEGRKAEHEGTAQEHSGNTIPLNVKTTVNQAAKLPRLGLVVPQLYKVREPHEVAEAVYDDRRREVPRPEEEEGAVHAEQRRVVHLEHRHEQGLLPLST